MKPDDIFNIPTTDILGTDVLEAWEKASHCLGELNQLSASIFDLSFIIDTLKNIEALNSAKIEGTTGNLEDLYLEQSLSYEKKVQLKLFSALNYKLTINELERIITEYKTIDVSVVRHMHKLLTENDPATHGKAGSFRNTQVKIRNSKLGDFFPPDAINVPLLMDNLFKPIFSIPSKSLPAIAIRHFQFESIHPFEDGNGRTGRMLILADLLYNGHLVSPILNISQFFERNRDNYIFALRKVTDSRSYKEWLLFFLNAIEKQSAEVSKLINNLKAIKKGDEEKVYQDTKNATIPILLLEFALQEFYFTINEFENWLKRKKVPLKAPYQTARNNVLRFEEIGILAKSHKRGQSVTYVHTGLRDVLMKKPGSNVIH